MSWVKYPLPQPIPETPIRGVDVEPIVFQSPKMQALAKAARKKSNSRWALIKPKRSSRGILWRGQPFYWSTKGFYRPGLRDASGRRQPLHHAIWEFYHGQTVPRGHEIFFTNRDRHDFRIENLELLSKAACHERIHQLGENKQLTPEQRGQIAGKRWTRYARNVTTLLLKKFNSTESHDHSSTLAGVVSRKQKFTHGPKRD